MISRFLNHCFFIFSCLSISSCSSGYSQAEELGQKWCTCNESMARFYHEMNASESQEKKDELAIKIVSEQAEVLKCMGGEEKLKRLNNQFSGTNFQKIYDKSRQTKCPESVKLLSKKGNTLR